MHSFEKAIPFRSMNFNDQCCRLDHVVGERHNAEQHSLVFRCEVSGNLFCVNCAKDIFFSQIPDHQRRGILLGFHRLLEANGVHGLPADFLSTVLPALLSALESADPTLSALAVEVLQPPATADAPNDFGGGGSGHSGGSQFDVAVALPLAERMAAIGLPRAAPHLFLLARIMSGAGPEERLGPAAARAAPFLAAALAGDAARSLSEEIKSHVLFLALELLEPRLDDDNATATAAATGGTAAVGGAGAAAAAAAAGPAGDPFVQIMLRVPAVLAAAARPDTQTHAVDYLAAAS
ncbi:unnamed protein product, partial [Phaeothamnion confervicola]